MKRRTFLSRASFAGGFALSSPVVAGISSKFHVPEKSNEPPANTREYWLQLLIKIAGPVMQSMSNGTLKKTMPLETGPGYSKTVKDVTYLEAFARTASGMAPWLSLGQDETNEGKLRGRFIDYFIKGLSNGINPASADYLGFDLKTDGQPLVDIAFLVQAFMRAPNQLWDPLDESLKRETIKQLKQLQWVLPGYSNWLLFAAMVEAFYLWAGEPGWDPMRIDYAVKSLESWYKGDGYYGDGPHLHIDYYNDFVILPMLLEVLQVMAHKQKIPVAEYEKVLLRAKRHAAIQERLIAPDGTYPITGRSAPYRIAAFQNIGWLAWKNQLPAELMPGQVRAALTKMMKKTFEFPGTFDNAGWLQIGVCGHQQEIADDYTSTGSLYLCTNGFLPLGLPPSHPFWTATDEEWTSVKIWSGKAVKKDHAIDN